MPSENASTGLILAIESSCDETAAAIVRDGHQVIANVVASQHELHEKFGGVVPEIASRAHIEKIGPIIQQTFEQANLMPNQIDAVAIGHRPGLIGSLLVGLSAAKAIAWSLGRPLIGVDHVQAHLQAAVLDDAPLRYPALGLVVSGGHTSLFEMNGPLDTTPLGRTIDDAVGEAYDKVAMILGLGYPGGPLVDQRAQLGNPKAINFPRTLLKRDDLNFSFSGIKTSVLYTVRGQPQKKDGQPPAFQRSADDLSEEEKNDVAASFQAAVVDVIIKKLERAADQLTERHQAPQSLVVGGGVSANSHLRERVLAWGQANQIDVRLPKMTYCLDNAAMLAALAHHRYIASDYDDLSLAASATSQPKK